MRVERGALSCRRRPVVRWMPERSDTRLVQIPGWTQRRLRAWEQRMGIRP